ncbi:DUF2254 domain-containing protein [Rhodoplanes elegans]|nr:DUF2254 domain-containing protein [Rhodoplanes elegans]
MTSIRVVIAWLRTRLWLIPLVMSAFVVAVAYLVLFSSLSLGFASLSDHWWVFSGDASTARDLLATLLSGMITMTSLVVSITMVVLSLAAGQLGPRLIWNFIEDRQIQILIGLFVATIMYTLIVLRSINEELGPDRVPHVAITAASLLVVTCLFALLFYVHKLARAIISDTMVNKVARRLERAIAERPMGRSARVGGPLPSGSLERSISIDESGYVQWVDYAALCRIACRHDALVTVRVRAGQFVVRGRKCIELQSGTAVPDDIERTIRATVVIGDNRSPEQDLEYSIRQLVEIALRALSPGINDVFTAAAVVDRLAAAMERVGRHSLPPAEHVDERGTVRVLADVSTWEGLLDAAFTRIRQSAARQPAILVQLARRMADLAEVAPSDVQSHALVKHLEVLRRLGSKLDEQSDRDEVEGAASAALERAARASGRPG